VCAARPLAVATAALVSALVSALVAGCGPTTTSSTACKTALLPGDLVITEVFADYKASAAGNGSDTGKEWFEIYNATHAAIDLAGLTITHSRLDGSQLNRHAVGAATIAPGQFFTLGSAPPGAAPPYVDYGYGDDLGDLSNSAGGTLALACGDREIDRASYGEVREGHARELTGAVAPDYTLNDDAGNWCQASDGEFEAGNFGTPGADNDCRPSGSGQCSDGGTARAAVVPGPGDLVISEVMPSPTKVADSAGEWFEARAMADVDLNGVGVRRIAGGAVDLEAAAECRRVAAGSTVVFARSATANGGLPGAIAGGFSFNLIAGAPGAPGDVALVVGTTIIDAVTWTRSTEGAALQLDPSRIDAAANDLESNFCNATVAYGSGDLGTPGSDNPPCPALPSPGTCADGAGRVRSIARPAAGALVISEVLANPANVAGATDAQREWFEITNVGSTVFDLNELVVGRIGAAGAQVQSARCLSVVPGSFAVFARSADPALDGMLPGVAATFRFGLVDTSGDIQIADGATVLDAVRWAKATPGVASQLDAAHLSATDNDDASRFCAATAAYGDLTNLGTPGAANRPCP